MMSPERWALVRQVLDAALELPPQAREAHIAAACGGDPELRHDVERLARGCADAERDPEFLSEPAAEFAAPVFAQVEAWESGDKSGPDVDAEKLGEALAGHYTIERELGHGGMATVFLAHDLRHGRVVALKVMKPGLLAGTGAERFLREIRIVARLPHPHILPLHDSGEAGGLLYYVMPFVEGESLRARLAREGSIAVADAVRILREVASALAYAHRQEIVHRDIKPENILLQHGQAVVADFGIARAIGRALETGQARDLALGAITHAEDLAGGAITYTGVTLGTPAYMAPEQAAGNPHSDHRADLYALGAVAYEMLVGAPPFVRHTPEELRAAHLTETPEPLATRQPEIPAGLADLVQRLLAKRPEDRPESADAVLAELERIATGPVEYRKDTTSTSRRLAVWGAGAFLVLLGGAALLSRPDGSGPRVEATYVAVLPFENLGAPKDDYFADGVVDAVRGKLAELSGLLVIARGSSEPYKGSGKTPQQIAAELGVQYLLTGRIRWERRPDGSSRVRVTPELVRVAPGAAPTIVWQRPYDARLTDVFEVQADIASRVAQALDVALGAPARERLHQPPTRNLAAYDAFLKAQEAPLYGGGLAFFQQAVDLDSTYLAAWAGLSKAYSRTLGNTALGRKEARRTALRAIALGPARPEGPIALGVYYFEVEHDDDRAREQFALARRLGGNTADVLMNLSFVDTTLAAAVEHAQQAARLEPRSDGTLYRLSRLLLQLRRYEDARQVIDRGLALQPTGLPWFGRKTLLFLMLGDLAGARAVQRDVPTEVKPAALVSFFVSYWDLFWVLDDERQQLLLHLTPAAFNGDRAFWAFILAQTHWLRGDPARARAYADSARPFFERELREVPSNPMAREGLGLTLAYLGRCAEAVREGERGVGPEIRAPHPGRAGAEWEGEGALQLRPGDDYALQRLARIYVICGQNEKAIDHLEALLRMRGYITPRWLGIDPNFAPLRGNPRFERLVARS
jgi:serine/threonine-protein kinase